MTLKTTNDQLARPVVHEGLANMTLQMVHSASDLPAGWDDLIIGKTPGLPTHELYVSSPWLRSVELFGDFAPTHLTISADDRIVGGLATHRVDDTTSDLRVRVDNILDDEGLHPARVVGGLNDGHTGALTASDLDSEQRADVIDQLFAGAEQVAIANGERLVVCRCVDSDDDLLRGVLADRGYHELSGHDHFVLTPPPGGLDGYIESFSSRYRNMIRRELRKLREAGVVISVEPMTPDLIAAATPLIDNLNARYHVEMSQETVSAGLRVQRRYFKGNHYGVVARIADQIVGFMGLVIHQGSAWARQVGFDYQANGTLPVYFGVLFYGALDFAADRKLQIVDYSFTAHAAKEARGCIARPTVRLFRTVS
jgi:hypothetical protein